MHTKLGKTQKLEKSKMGGVSSKPAIPLAFARASDPIKVPAGETIYVDLMFDNGFTMAPHEGSFFFVPGVNAQLTVSSSGTCVV